VSGTDTAAMIPNRYDVVIDGFGYIFPNVQDERARYTYTPTFLQRTNVGSAYGDNQQDFFLTASQNDWSLGEEQRFFHPSGEEGGDSARRYFRGSALETHIPGQATLLPAIRQVSNSDTVITSCFKTPSSHYYTTSANLKSIAGSTGVVTDHGAHGAGAVTGMATDGGNVFISGTTKVRKWNGAAFSDFNATASVGALAFLNNALYSCDGAVLRVYDTAGTATTLYTWKDAAGATIAASNVRLVPFGGSLLISFPALTGRPQLWIYDGVSTSKIAEFPLSSIGFDLCVLDGIVYLSGTIFDASAGTTLGVVPVIWYYVNGTIGTLWRSQDSVVLDYHLYALSFYNPALGTLGGRLVFTDTLNLRLLEYDPLSGSISTLGTFTTSSNLTYTSTPVALSSVGTNVLVTIGGTGSSPTNPDFLIYPHSSNFATSGYIQTSQFDFENALTKVFRGVKVVWSGSNGSVDLSYSIDGGSFTALQTGAVSGTEYTLPANTTGATIAVKATLNYSSGGPTLKRIYVRASPVQQSFRRCEYALDLTGFRAGNPVRRRDGSDHTLTGSQMATNLNTAITSTTPLTITDRFGTYTGVLEPGGCEIIEHRPGEFVARVTIRQV
jgi:hypothetical protein